MAGGNQGSNSWRNAPPPGLERGNAPTAGGGGRQQPWGSRGGRNKAYNNSHGGSGGQKGAGGQGGSSAGANASASASAINNGAGGPAQHQEVDGTSAVARLRFVHEVLVGHKVRVQVKDGLTYEGILHTIGTTSSKDYDVVLLMAETVRDESKDGDADADNEIVQRPQAKLVVHSNDVIQITAKSVRTDAASVGPVNQAVGSETDAGGFGTDASISRGKATGYGRQLERWTAPPESEGAIETAAGGAGHPPPSVSGAGGGLPPVTVAAGAASDGKDWDQFAAFERMTGAKSTYTEEQYTTALNKNDPRMKALEAQAERIAREIEGQTSTNSHVAEERGHYIDDSGMDEEDKYSGVLRAPVKAQPAARDKSTKAKDQDKKTAGAQAASADAKLANPKSSGLNLNAKPFSFNANAKEFVPGARKPAAAAVSSAAGRGPGGFVGAGMMGTYVPQTMPGMQQAGFMMPGGYRPNPYAPAQGYIGPQGVPVVLPVTGNPNFQQQQQQQQQQHNYK